MCDKDMSFFRILSRSFILFLSHFIFSSQITRGISHSTLDFTLALSLILFSSRGFNSDVKNIKKETTEKSTDVDTAKSLFIHLFHYAVPLGYVTLFAARASSRLS